MAIAEVPELVEGVEATDVDPNSGLNPIGNGVEELIHVVVVGVGGNNHQIRLNNSRLPGNKNSLFFNSILFFSY